MNPSENSAAFGAPGTEPRWTSSAKEGVGTAYHTSCRLWFTLSHGIINEIYWSGLQLDEIAAPILLAWRLYKQDAAIGLFDPRVMILRAAAYLILQGPVTGQDRWEENAGYSPSTLATVIASLVCVAECANELGNTKLADFILAYADWLAAHIEEWTVTTQGELTDGFPRHYIRIN